MSSHLGGYIVRYAYRVDPMNREQLLPLLGTVRDYTVWLGLSGFEVLWGEDDPWLVAEYHGYDSWSHHQRLAQRETPPEINAVYEAMDGLIEGGLRAIVSEAWSPVKLPDPAP